MNREDLEKLRALRQELDTLEREYMKMPKTESVGDTYGDYSTGYKRTKVVYGISTLAADALREKIESKADELSKMVVSLEDFIDSVADPEIRDILRLHYANGLSHREIAKRKGYSRSAISKKLDKYWEQS